MQLPQAFPIRGEPIDSRLLIKGDPKEYAIELYLLQNLDRLEELVGCGVSEVYNQLYGYAGRYLDILVLHREDERLLKASVIEIKADTTRLEEGVNELAHYMYWASDKVTGDPEATLGIMLAPLIGLADKPPKEQIGKDTRALRSERGEDPMGRIRGQRRRADLHPSNITYAQPS